MAPCTHQQWLRVHRDENDFVLQYGDRLGSITRSFPSPATQYPSLVFFIGKQAKSRALRALFPGNSISSCRKYGIANICADSRTVNRDHPILIADSTPDYAQTTQRGEAVCHETVNYSVAWPDDEAISPTHHGLVDHLHARVFSLFIDVLCIFAQDCGGLDGVAERIACWTALGSASSLPNCTRPRLVVVASIPGHTFDSEVLRFRLKLLANPRFADSFSSLSTVNILGTSYRPSPLLYSGVEEVIYHEASMARVERLNTHTLFSMIHIAAFFESALRHFVKSPRYTFDFIRSSREENQISPYFANHLKSFLNHSLKHKLADHILWDFVGSALIFDSFPPDMHLFNPSEVFRTLYREACLLGIHDYSSKRQLSGEMICGEIEAHMISFFSFMKFTGQSAATLRQQSLQQNSDSWQLLKSNVDCFICLQRKPEHALECGHSVCDFCMCIRNFSRPTSDREYCFDINTCPQCQAQICFQGRRLPPTCRTRFLAFDGGGSRGIVSLGFVDELQQALGLDYPVQENFDYAIGTSSGGLAVIGLFGKYWTPKECLAFFRKFARIIFPPKAAPYSICAWIRRIFQFYLEDGKYNSAALEAALKEALGPGPVFGPVASRPSGIRFAVTATTISDATLCLISNYNGEGQTGKSSGYKHLRAAQAAEEILLWEAARCTTAAPSFFKPKRLGAFGTLQDGGLKNNNPARPGLRAVEGDCDLVLSIGTGFEQKLASPIASNVRNLFQDGAVARFYRASMHSLSLDGQVSWDDHWFGLDEDAKRQQFRLNLPLVGKEPEIDDVDQMQYLHDQIQYHLGDIDGIARAFKAVSFFFELDGPLVLEGGRYHCRGSILSRSPDSRNLIQSIGRSHPNSQFFNKDLSLGFLSPSDICKTCGRFQKAITFDVRHPSDRVDLQLVFSRLFRRSISGFPQPLEWFVWRQKLNARFGQPDHKSRIKRSGSHSCSCELRRHSENSVPASDNKKRSNPFYLRRPKKRKCI